MLKSLLRFVLSQLEANSVESVLQERYPSVDLYGRDLCTTTSLILTEELEKRGHTVYYGNLTTDYLITQLASRTFNLNDNRDVAYLLDLAETLRKNNFIVLECEEDLVEYLKAKYPTKFYETVLEAIKGLKNSTLRLSDEELTALLGLVNRETLSVSEIEDIVSTQLRKHGASSIRRSMFNKILSDLFISNAVTDREVIELLRNYFNPRSKDNGNSDIAKFAVVLKNDDTISANYVVDTLLAKTSSPEYDKDAEYQRCRDWMMKAHQEGTATLATYLHIKDAEEYVAKFADTDLTVVVQDTRSN